MHVLENESLRVSIADTGAELCSVVDKESGLERLWSADPAVWNRHAPILFPFVGKVVDGRYRIGDQEYEMKTQHGFARDMEFTCLEETEDSITHCLLPTDGTREVYPFEFRLLIRHSLCPENPRRLDIQWTVGNRGEETMLYSIGGHPGFLPPPGIRKQDCFLLFPGAEELRYFSADEKGFARPDREKVLRLQDGFAAYQEDIPATWIFPDGQVSTVTLALPDRRPYVTMLCAGFPLLAVWGSPQGPFICLEPWYGRTDDAGFSGTLAEKAEMQRLVPGGSRQIRYSIEFHPAV